MGHGVNSREVQNRVVSRGDQKWPFSQPCQIRLAMIQSSLDLWFASQGHQEIQEIHHGHHGKWFEEPSTIWHGNTMDIFHEIVGWTSKLNLNNKKDNNVYLFSVLNGCWKGLSHVHLNEFSTIRNPSRGYCTSNAIKRSNNVCLHYTYAYYMVHICYLVYLFCMIYM